MKEFIRALQAKDYGALEVALATMQIEVSYATARIQTGETYTIFASSVTEVDEEEELVISAKDWSPLAAAAFAQDRRAIEMVIQRFSHDIEQLVDRALKTLSQIAKDARHYGPKTCQKADSASILVKQLYLINAPDGRKTKPMSFSAKEQQAIVQSINDTLSETKSVADVVEMYDRHCDTPYITAKQGIGARLFGGSQYSHSKIDLINYAQARAKALIDKAFHDANQSGNYELVQSAIETAVRSTLFDPLHASKGVRSETTNALSFLQSHVATKMSGTAAPSAPTPTASLSPEGR